MITGSVITTIALSYGRPRLLFGIRGMFYFIAFIQGYFMNKALDTNQKAK